MNIHKFLTKWELFEAHIDTLNYRLRKTCHRLEYELDLETFKRWMKRRNL